MNPLDTDPVLICCSFSEVQMDNVKLNLCVLKDPFQRHYANLVKMPPS